MAHAVNKRQSREPAGLVPFWDVVQYIEERKGKAILFIQNVYVNKHMYNFQKLFQLLTIFLVLIGNTFRMLPLKIAMLHHGFMNCQSFQTCSN